jgi:hypothetical protein
MAAIGRDVDQANQPATRSERLFIKTEVDMFVVLTAIAAGILVVAGAVATIAVVLGVVTQ